MRNHRCLLTSISVLQIRPALPHALISPAISAAGKKYLLEQFVFRQILDEDVGEISYDEDAELIYGNDRYDAVPHAEPEPELVIIDREANDEPEEMSPEEESYQDLEKAQLEARAYAEKIKDWIGKTVMPPCKCMIKRLTPSGISNIVTWSF